ncbi:unnamed protein product, partial [marine sediment metagenome]
QKIIMDQQIKESSESTDSKKRILDNLKEYCKQMYSALARGELDAFGKILDEAWNMKRKLSPKISNERIDEIYLKAKEAGAIGGKITGAGGGGCMIFFCKSNHEHKVSEVLQQSGAKVIDFSFEKSGMVSWELKRESRKIK